MHTDNILISAEAAAEYCRTSVVILKAANRSKITPTPTITISTIGRLVDSGTSITCDVEVSELEVTEAVVVDVVRPCPKTELIRMR